MKESMKIELHQIKIRELIDGYKNDDEEGVVAYHGLLNVRPKYQREFVYPPEKQIAVLRSVMQRFPIGVMYWVRNEDGTLEMLDGQQRTVSICEYVAANAFSIDSFKFHNLQDAKPKKAEEILDYKLQVYLCEGSTDDKLEWFRTINIGTEPLKEQEMRNAFYTGEWLTDAKKKFSKVTGVCVRKNEGLVSGTPNRQELLEKALLWKAQYDGINEGKPDLTIRRYMAEHQHDANADSERQYFFKVIDWANMLFDGKWKIKKGQPWGELYNLYHNNEYNSAFLHSEVDRLLLDDEVEKSGKSGIIRYLLSGEEKYLNLRTFSEAQKLTLYQRQGGLCNICKKPFPIEEMEADHREPWSEGGKTTLENGQMLCRHCNRTKSNK